MLAANNWISTNTLDIPIENTITILTKYKLYILSLTPGSSIYNYILTTFQSGNPSLLLKAILIRYIFNNINNDNSSLFTNLNNIMNSLASGSKNLSQWETISNEGFKNYTNNKSLHLDYSKISMDNGSSIWHNKMNGSPFSPKL